MKHAQSLSYSSAIRVGRPLLALILLLLIVPGITLANEFELRGGCKEGSNPDDVTALVTPDGKLAVRLSFLDGGEQLLVSYNPLTGKKLDEKSYSIGGIPGHIELARVSGAYRVVVFPSGNSLATFAIFDLSSEGNLELRATASIPVSGIYTVRARKVHPTLGVGFYRITPQGSPSILVAFSLDNGQVISTYEGLSFGDSVALITGAPSIVVAPTTEQNVAVAAIVDVSDPANMVGLGEARYAWEYDLYPLGSNVSDSAVTGDERHVFLASASSGLWALDLATRTFVGPRADPQDAGRLAYREFGSRRTLAAFGRSPITNESTLSVYDASDPSSLVLRLRTQHPGSGSATIMSPDGEQLVFQVDDGLRSIETREGRLLWSYDLEPLQFGYTARIMYEIPPFGAVGAIWIGGTSRDAFRGVALNVPYGVSTVFDGDDLVVTCLGADRKAVVVVDGIARITKQKRRNLGTLRVKSIRSELAGGQTIDLHVLNPSGTRSIDVRTVVPVP